MGQTRAKGDREVGRGEHEPLQDSNTESLCHASWDHECLHYKYSFKESLNSWGGELNPKLQLQKLHDIGFGNDFLDTTLKAQTTKEKHKLDYIQM